MALDITARRIRQFNHILAANSTKNTTSKHKNQKKSNEIQYRNTLSFNKMDEKNEIRKTTSLSCTQKKRLHSRSSVLNFSCIKLSLTAILKLLLLSLSLLAGFPFVCQECNKSDLCAWLTSGFSWAYTHTYSVVR